MSAAVFLPAYCPPKEPAVGQAGSRLIFLRALPTDSELVALHGHAKRMGFTLVEERPVEGVLRLNCGSKPRALKLWRALTHLDDAQALKNLDGTPINDRFTGMTYFCDEDRKG